MGTCATEPENLGKFTSVLIIYIHTRCFFGVEVGTNVVSLIELGIGAPAGKVQDNLRTLVRKTGKYRSFSRQIRERLVCFDRSSNC